jgi:CO/xanthine dehydrogenase Mo-binding subunit
MTAIGVRTGAGTGVSVARPDGVPKVRGDFAFASDLWMDGMLWGHTLRAPHASARIRSIDIGPALAVPRPQPRVVATFKLTRAATVTPRIETPSGVLLRKLAPVKAQPGDVTVSWDGRTDGGAVVYSGAYVAEATAVNELGAVTLGATFQVRRQ